MLSFNSSVVSRNILWVGGKIKKLICIHVKLCGAEMKTLLRYVGYSQGRDVGVDLTPFANDRRPSSGPAR